MGLPAKILGPEAFHEGNTERQLLSSRDAGTSRDYYGDLCIISASKAWFTRGDFYDLHDICFNALIFLFCW